MEFWGRLWKNREIAESITKAIYISAIKIQFFLIIRKKDLVFFVFLPKLFKMYFSSLII